MNRPLKPFAPAGSRGRVLKTKKVADSVHLLEVEILDLSGAESRPKPGQFYHIKCSDGPEHLLRRPLSIHGINRWNAGAYTLELLVESVGWGTQRLCLLAEGSELDLLGPLGRGFDIHSGGRAIVVGGGMGIAPLFFLAREMELMGIEYDFVAGFKSRETSCTTTTQAGGVVTVICTEDGSLGVKGTAVGEAELLMEKNRYTCAYVCGPEAMMAGTAVIAEQKGIPCQVSLVSRMACGIGVCRGCVRPGKNDENLCVCTDGPVFDSRKVEWLNG